MLIIVAISLTIGFALGYFFYIRRGITTVEDKHRAERETWKLKAAG